MRVLSATGRAPDGTGPRRIAIVSAGVLIPFPRPTVARLADLLAGSGLDTHCRAL